MTREEEYFLRERIRQLREKAGLTQTDLAKQMGVDASTVCHWERGSIQPDLNKVCKLADLFHVTVDYLLGRETG